MPTTPEGVAWLKANAAKEGVVVTASGLQYKVLQAAAEGALSPKSGTPCECHYRGTLLDGTEFDSSYKRGKPTTFAPFQVVKGWTEAMQLMAEGDKWQLFLPSELAYGDKMRGEYITPGAVLIFELEILTVNGQLADGTAKAKPGPPPPPPPPPPSHVAVGSRVQVDGLVAKPQFNGLHGTVVSWDGAKGRAGVRLDSGEGGAGLMLKPGNLSPSDQPAPRVAAPLIIWLHGLGDSGRGWAHLPSQLRLSSAVRYEFPDAPDQPVSRNGGLAMPSWMDLRSIPVCVGDADDESGLAASCERVHSLIDAAVAAGTPACAIVLGGFSQGGALALYAGYSYPQRLAAIVSFSGWAVLAAGLVERVASGANAKTPAFLAHGTQDGTVEPACTVEARDLLKAASVPTAYFTYPMAHSSCPSQFEDLKDWLATVGVS